MNCDGWGQSGAGDSDMRQGGDDLQHARQHVSQNGPVKEELQRHEASRVLRLGDLKRAYER